MDERIRAAVTQLVGVGSRLRVFAMEMSRPKGDAASLQNCKLKKWKKRFCEKLLDVQKVGSPRVRLQGKELPGQMRRNPTWAAEF